MKELLAHLRAMQLYAQNAHHLVKGSSFHSDHAFFGDVYESVAGDFDDLSERIVGLYGEEPIALIPMLQSVQIKLQQAPSIGVADNKVFYEFQLALENKLCELVSVICKSGPTHGTEQLITEMCNKSEARKYRIKQRLK